MNIQAFKTASRIVGCSTIAAAALLGLVFFSVTFFTNPIFAFLVPITTLLATVWALIYWVESR